MALRRVEDDEWAGDDVDDLVAYFGADPPEFAPDQIVVARCVCGGQVFELETTDSSTLMRRRCFKCDQTTYMLDSADWWYPLDEEAKARYICECTCGEDAFEVAVGFSFYEDSPTADVRWVYIAARCTTDGLLGYYSDWKVRHHPSHQLVDSV